MEMQFDFVIENSSEALDETAWFVFGFTLLFDFFQWCAGENVERALVDCLVARIEFRDNEMHGRAVCQHVMTEGVFVRAKTGERG